MNHPWSDGATTARRGRRRCAIVCLAVAVSSGLGCATYTELTAQGRTSVTAGAYDDAVDAFDRALGVDERDELPPHISSKDGLLLLERGMVSQAQGFYPDSARDLGQADETLEYYDLATDAVGTIAKYVFSDSAGTYRASPVEKLALNAVNMANYLAMDDLEGARVEAKRFTVMRDYLADNGLGSIHGTMGSYLAGFVFEHLGDANAAMRYYDEAIGARDLASLAAPVGRLAKLTAYRGKHIDGYLAEHRSSSANTGSPPSEILTIVSLGRVPFKVPERMPIGAAIGLAGTHISGDPDVLGYTALKFIVYPELQPAIATFGNASVAIDGEDQTLELTSNFGAATTTEYQRMKPKIIGAAVSRMIARAAVAEGARQAGKEAGGDKALVGWVAALLTEATMVALDKPDTRSWTLLPDRVYVSRTVVAPGPHTVTVDLGGYQSETRSTHVDVPKGGFAAFVVTPLR